ncbi:MAG TPA: hypothetical protein VEL76_17070 [Gemmataceae bacterium]|nr:hypothetical protein [Gemmataceae bacterium]
MSRRWLVPWLVVALFLSGCKSSYQGGADPINQVEDALWSAQKKCDDWLERHPIARHTANVVAGVVLIAGVIALTGFLLWAYCQDDTEPVNSGSHATHR